jgi:hypothetical protein
MGMAPEARPVPFITENTPLPLVLPPPVFPEPQAFPLQAFLLGPGQLASRDDQATVGRRVDGLIVCGGMVWSVGRIGHVAIFPMISVLVLGLTILA